MAASVNVGEAAKILGIGAVIGALGFYILSKTNIQITPNTGNTVPTGQTIPNTMPAGQATTLSAKAYPAFGYDFSDDGWNNSEVWDSRNKTYFSDNILFNKLPYIPMDVQHDFNPSQMLTFSQAYDHNTDQDSPRPRFGTHALDREIADQVYPRKTPLPFYF